MSTTESSARPVVVPCPNCEQQLKVPPDRIGVACRCSACKVVLTPQPPTEPDDPCPLPEEFVFQDDCPQSECTNSALPIEFENFDSLDEIDDADDAIETTTPSGYARRPSGLSMRAKRWIVWGVLRFALSLCFIFAGAFLPPVGCLGFLLLLWYWPARALEPYVSASLFSTLRSPGCGFEYDAIGRWTVGSYTDHRERHIALAKDRIHGGDAIGHTDCPQCSATLLV